MSTALTVRRIRDGKVTTWIAFAHSHFGVAGRHDAGRQRTIKIDNQLGCSAYFGRVADDPRYPFPIYHDLLELKAPDNWRPEEEIKAARSK